MITDEEIEKAVDYLRDNARVAGKAKAHAVYLDDFSKVVKSSIMREQTGESLGAQEARAYADPRYHQHLLAKEIADEAHEYHRWMMTAAEAKIEAWRTQQSNARALGKLA